ncbi:MAG: DUF4856 domain-containing protein [Flavobacteriales bacterium]|nr:DUF4856 domain-containing protein [Flavobacteriales bacterium]
MKRSKFKAIALIGLSLSISLSSCKDDDDETPTPVEAQETLATPASYDFTRNNMTTVSYGGQITRLNQLAAMKAELGKGDKGNVVSAQALKDMFSNVGGHGNGRFVDTTTKQLKNKTFNLDQVYFEDLFDSAAVASIAGSNGTMAASGVAGIANRSGSKTILVDANGREYTQLVEKGLMGATFYNQIVNNYLTTGKIGDGVNNTDLETGKNFTKMEHHMDEAFGYVGAPVDFKSNYSGTGDVRYWANYSKTADDNIQMNDRLMNAFKRARAGIAEKKYTIRDQEAAKINSEFEILIAATAIHYANEAKAATVDGDRLHVLSECYAFTRAFRYSNVNTRKLTQTEVDTLLAYIGTNFWNTTTSNLDFLINKLASTYGLESVKANL